MYLLKKEKNMKQYKTIINEPNIVLSIMNREKLFKKFEIVNENIYTKTYPDFFREIGEVKGIKSFLSKPFFKKEEKLIKKTVKQVKLEELSKLSEPKIEMNYGKKN